VRVDTLHHDADDAALRRELHGVAQQVPEHLLEATGVAGDDDAGVEHLLEAHAPGLGRGPRGLHRLLDQRRQVHALHVEAHLAGGDAAHVQQVVDELRLDAGVALDDGNPFEDFRAQVRLMAE
jgi:hypothetical protein